MGKRTTIADIAKESGYSRTAVSFAFNDPGKLSKESVAAIMKAAKKLDYYPDPIARNFLRGKCKSIGFLLPQSIQSSLSNPYTMDVIKGVGSVCEEKGYNLTLLPPLHSSIPEALKEAMVDGAITMGHTLEMGIHEILRQRHMPLVTIDGALSKGVTCVNIDDETAAYTEMNAALEAGHKQIAVVAFVDYDNTNESTASKRLKGYEKALKKAGLSLTDVKILKSEATFQGGVQAGEEIFSAYNNVTCIITMADIIAFGILKSAENNNIKIPEQCSLLGFDGVKDTFSVFAELTTINQPAEIKGHMAAKALFDIIEGVTEEDKIFWVPFSLESGKTLQNNR